MANPNLNPNPNPNQVAVVAAGAALAGSPAAARRRAALRTRSAAGTHPEQPGTRAAAGTRRRSAAARTRSEAAAAHTVEERLATAAAAQLGVARRAERPAAAHTPEHTPLVQKGPPEGATESSESSYCSSTARCAPDACPSPSRVAAGPWRSFDSGRSERDHALWVCCAASAVRLSLGLSDAADGARAGDARFAPAAGERVSLPDVGIPSRVYAWPSQPRSVSRSSHCNLNFV